MALAKEDTEMAKTDAKFTFRGALFKREEIDKSIETVREKHESLQGYTHRVALSILKVWESALKSDDLPDVAAWSADRLNMLIANSSYHGKALSNWVQKFTPCLWSDETEAFYVNVNDCKLMGKAFIEARDNPFWMVSPPPKAKPFNLLDYIEKGMGTAAKRVKTPKKDAEGNDVEDFIPMELYYALMETVSKFKAEQPAE